MKKYFTLEESLDYLNKNLLENKLSKEDLFYLIGKNELQPLFYYAGVVFWIGKTNVLNDEYFKGYLKPTVSMGDVLRNEETQNYFYVKNTYLYEKIDGFIPNDFRGIIVVYSYEAKDILAEQFNNELQLGIIHDQDFQTYCYFNQSHEIKVNITDIRFRKENLDQCLLQNNSSPMNYNIGTPTIGHADTTLYQQQRDQLQKENEQLKTELEQAKARISELEANQQNAPQNNLLDLIFDDTAEDRYAPDLVLAIKLWEDLYIANPKNVSHSNRANTWVKNNTPYTNENAVEVKRLREIISPFQRWSNGRKNKFNNN